MNKQIMIMRNGTIPSANLINKIKGQGVKPSGGMWTASELNNGQSSWSIWCSMEMPEWIKDCKRFALTIKDNVNVYTINSVEDMMELYNRFPGNNIDRCEYFNWEEIAKVYDGVHLTEEGQCNTRYTDSVSLYGWDMESTVWFNWVFEEVIELTEWDTEETWEDTQDQEHSLDLNPTSEEFIISTREYVCNSAIMDCKYRCVGSTCKNDIFLDELVRLGGTKDQFVCKAKYFGDEED